MKKIIFILLSVLHSTIVLAQLDISISPIPEKAIQDSAMLIQVGNRKLEILSNKTAIRQSNGNFQIIDSKSLYSKDIFGVAYDHTQRAYVFLNGEIGFKFLTGNNLSSVPSAISLRSKLIVGPYNYALNATSPSDLVYLYNLLKSNQTIEWVELNTIQGKVN
jgi:hypothetical protein